MMGYILTVLCCPITVAFMTWHSRDKSQAIIYLIIVYAYREQNDLTSRIAQHDHIRFIKAYSQPQSCAHFLSRQLYCAWPTNRVPLSHYDLHLLTSQDPLVGSLNSVLHPLRAQISCDVNIDKKEAGGHPAQVIMAKSRHPCQVLQPTSNSWIVYLSTSY